MQESSFEVSEKISMHCSVGRNAKTSVYFKNPAPLVILRNLTFSLFFGPT